MNRVVFAGTPEFAGAALDALLDAGVRPVAVLTQPDRPAGRGKKIRESSVKKIAQQHELLLLQPVSLRNEDIVRQLESLRADLFVVAAYGLLLPQTVLDIPRSGCVNVHASLLPRWRGAAPIQAAILAADEQTGISLMRMEAGLDTGPVYVSSAIDIGATETAGELHDRLARLGGELLVEHLPQIAAGTLRPVEQTEAAATSAAKIRTDDARLDWNRSAAELQRVVRAYNPVPGAWTTLHGERIKCWAAATSADQGDVAGSVLSSSPDGIVVACGDGALCLTRLQRPGKTAVSAHALSGQLELDGAMFV